MQEFGVNGQFDFCYCLQDTQIYLNCITFFAVVGRIGVLAVPHTGNRLYAGISNYWVNL